MEIENILGKLKEEKELELATIQKENEESDEDYYHIMDDRNRVEEKYKLAFEHLPLLKSQLKDNRKPNNVVNACMNFCKPIFERLEPMFECMKYCSFDSDKLVTRLEYVKFKHEYPNLNFFMDL
jgi:hypothetical protein